MPDESISIAVAEGQVDATLLCPERLIPGILFVHGWGGCQEQDLELANGLARIGCICLTFDLRGHASRSSERDTVTRATNLDDVIAAYDRLKHHPEVDAGAIGVVGASYGGYLGAILTTRRPVRWLVLRAPALYRDDNWDMPKVKLDRAELNRYRQEYLSVQSNLALTACSDFEGDALVIESELDEIVPHPAVASYAAAFRNAHSLVYRTLDGSDHALSNRDCRKNYNRIVRDWVTEMVLGARQAG